jgi:hypothetical protein
MYGRSGGQSAVDPVLRQYAREEVAKSKVRKIQPLKMLFDILSRPQYVTANIAEEITRSIQTGEPIGQAAQDVAKGIWEGLTGKRKGDWEKILFGGAAEGSEAPDAFTGWAPGAGEQLSHPLIKFKPGASGEERGILRPKKWIGLAANIIMDPTTWIGLGPTKAAKSSAKQFAEDAAKIATKDPELAAKIVSSIDPKLAGNIDALLKKLKGGMKDATERVVTDTSRRAGKQALTTAPDVLRKQMGSQITDYMSKLAPKDWQETAISLQDVMGRLAKGDAYSGAGQRSLSLFGKDVAQVGQGPVSKGWDLLSGALQRSKGGQKFSDAMWAVMEKGPIGTIRRTFGFRNPYQSIVHAKKRESEILGDYLSRVKEIEVAQIFKGVDEADTKMLQDAMDKTAILRKTDPNANVYDVLNNPTVYNLKVKTGGQRSIADLYKKLKQHSDTQWAELQEGIQEGAISPVNYMDIYVPTRSEIDAMSFAGRATGAMKPGFAKKKTMFLEDHVEEAASMADLVFGDLLKPAAQAKSMNYDEFLRWFVKDRGFSSVNMNIEDMFLARSAAQAKALQRISLVRDFKQFGVPSAELLENGMEAIATANRLGLKTVSDPAFNGYLFDGEVAGILDKIYAVNSNKDTKGTIALAFKWWTQMWKNMVTLSAGFHVRNWMSNEMTGFLKNGMRNFDPRLAPDVLAGVAYGMSPGKYMDFLTGEMKMSKGAVAVALNKQRGGKSLQELSDYAAESGVIGWMSRGVDVPSDVKFGAKANRVVGTENPVFRFSKKVGSVIENTSKFKDFLINFEDAVNQGSNAEEAMAWAAEQTRKWFLDYGDLTDKEKALRNVVPFYSWLRKNVANQLSGMVLYPGAYNVIGKVQSAATKDEGLDYSLVPAYFEQQGMFQVGKDPETDYPVMFRPDFPFKDINMIPFTWEEGKLLPSVEGRELWSDIINAAHPLVKTIMAVAPEKGWNFFRRTDVKKQESAPAVFQYFAKNPKVIGVIDGIMRTAGFSEGIKVDMARDNNRVLMDGKAVAIMENHMPALRILGNLAEMGEEATKVLSGKGSLIEDLIEQVSGKQDFYEGLEDMFRVVGRLGVKFNILNTDYYLPIKRQEALDKARQRKSSDEYNAVTAQTRRTAYARSRNATLRRLGILQ